MIAMTALLDAEVVASDNTSGIFESFASDIKFCLVAELRVELTARGVMGVVTGFVDELMTGFVKSVVTVVR